MIDWSKVNVTAIADHVAEAATVVGKVAAAGAPLISALHFINDFSPVPVPFAGAVLDALNQVAPLAAKVAQAAPMVADAIKKGEPVLVRMQTEGVHLIPDVVAFYAAVTGQSVDQVKVEAAVAFLEANVRSIMERSYFQPQDERFDRAGNPSQF